MATKAMNYIRKNQKMMLAILTIGVMIIFIVGDAVQAMGNGGQQRRGILGWFKEKFGGKHEDTIFRVAGTNYNQDQLTALQQRRQFALQIMGTVYANGEERYLKDLGFSDAEISDNNKKQQKLLEMMGKDSTIREAMTARDNSILSQVRPSLSVFNMLNQPETPESLAEFIVMRNKAQELGISITNSSIRDDLLKLGMGKVSVDEINTTVRNLARTRGPSDMGKVDNVFSVLADEVKVGIAKQIAGEDISRVIAEIAYARAGMPFPDRSKPAKLTPADLWSSFVAVKTSLSTGILPIKVEDFLSRIAAPSEATLMEYFEKYKKDYPGPEKDTPGFKIPPMYRIGFVMADMKKDQPAQKHYYKVVDEWDRLAPFNALAELSQAYEAKKMTQYRTLQPYIEFALTKQPGSSWVRVYTWHAQQDHAHLAGILGNFALAATKLGTFSPGDIFSLQLMGEAVPPQTNEIIRAVETIAGATSLPGMLQPALTMRRGHKDSFVPFDVVVPVLKEQRYETKSKEYLNNDLTTITETLTEYGKKYSEWRSKVLRKLPTSATPPLYKDEPKQTLQEYLTKFTTARGLSYYETKDLRSKNNLLNEPNERLLNTFIKPLYYDPNDRATLRQLEDTVRYLLAKNEIGGDKPKLFEATNSSLYDSSRKNKEIALHWVAEASDPRTPTFKEAEADVLKAWKMEQARALTQEEAQRIVKDVQAGPDNYRKLIDMKGYAPGQVIARYSEPELKSTTDIPTYNACPIPKAVDNEPADFVTQCLDKLKNKGDTVVIPDRSKSVYYLIYLSSRSEPKTSNPLDLEAFHNEVIRPSMMRQLMIDGTSFRNFVGMEEKSQDVRSWIEYLKEITSYNPELGKSLSENTRQ